MIDFDTTKWIGVRHSRSSCPFRKYDSIMVESKIFSSTTGPCYEADPPLVPVQAVDVWHLEAVPVPSAPSYLYDDEHESFDEPVPTIITTEQEHTEEPTYIMVMEDEPDSERKLTVGAGVASGVVGL